MRTPDLGAVPGARWSIMIGNEFFLGIPDDIAAAVFSTPEWEPPFYLGLLRPLLYLALRGGIACTWGLRIQPGPRVVWMLTPETISSPGSAPGRTDFFTTSQSSPETNYAIFFSLAEWYTSSDFHIERMIDAIWRAMLSFARFGFVPPSSNC